MVDVSKYRKGKHITATELGEDTRVGAISDVRENSKFGKLELVFESGDMLSLNATNLEKMIGHYGLDDKLWIGKKVELYVGELPFNGKAVASVLLRPISPGVPKAGARAEGKDRPKAKARGDDVHRPSEDDEIPFNT
jgi:hypothetical protein